MKAKQLVFVSLFSVLTLSVAAQAAGDKDMGGRVDRQTVEFRDSEVPYFQAVKKGSKMKVTVVDPTSSEKVTMDKVIVSQSKTGEE